MGEVWRARHLTLNSPVAIKLINAASAGDEGARKRFLTEAQVTAQLHTRHAVRVFDFGFSDEGHPYIVMELLDGETVGHRIERLGRLTPGETVRFLQQAARALDQAHALGIVHRDFKPDNLVIVRDETGREHIKVLDFGIAKLVGDLEAMSEPAPVSRLGDTLVDATQNTVLTVTNSVVGTPLYMAPEQVRREEMLGPPADIWAFGVVAFECLTGRLPFDGKTLLEVFTRIQAGKPAKARDLRRELPAEVDEWFSMAFAQDPAARFGSALVAARALAVSLESRRWQIDLPATPAAKSSDPVLESDASDSDDKLPLSTTLDGSSARLLSRSRRTLDTHEPVSAPARPPTPAPSPVAKPEAGATSRRWLLAAASFAALIVVAGVATMQSDRPAPEPGDHAARVTPSAPGPADTRGRPDIAKDGGNDH